jgi:urease accessory protein UreF
MEEDIVVPTEAIAGALRAMSERIETEDGLLEHLLVDAADRIEALVRLTKAQYIEIEMLKQRIGSKE